MRIGAAAIRIGIAGAAISADGLLPIRFRFY